MTTSVNVHDLVQTSYHESENLFWAWLRNTVELPEYEQMRKQPFIFIRQLQLGPWRQFLTYTAWEVQGYVEEAEDEVAYDNDFEGVVFTTAQAKMVVEASLEQVIEEQIELWLEDMAFMETPA